MLPFKVSYNFTVDRAIYISVVLTTVLSFNTNFKTYNNDLNRASNGLSQANFRLRQNLKLRKAGNSLNFACDAHK